MNTPIKSYSPTSLGILDRNCPAALDHYFAAKQFEREFEIEGPEMAEIGIVFHVLVYTAARSRLKDEPPWEAMRAAAVALTQKIQISRVDAGRKMAEEFVKFWEFDTRLQYEHGVAFDPQWHAVDWDSPARRIRLIFDGCGVVDISDPVYGDLKVARGSDYKTGWGVRVAELDSIQMDVYTVALRKAFPDVDGIEIEIIATRFNKVFRRLFVFGEEDHDAELRKRKDNVEFWMDAADKSTGVARVGHGCMKCNFPSVCTEFQKYSTALLTTPAIATDPEELARDYAVLQAKTVEVKDVLMSRTEAAPIKVGSHVLGYSMGNKRELLDPTAAFKIWQRASKIELSEDAERSMLAFTKSLKLGVTATENVIKAAAPALGYKSQKAAVESESPKIMGEKGQSKWGWQDDPEAE